MSVRLEIIGSFLIHLDTVFKIAAWKRLLTAAEWEGLLPQQTRAKHKSRAETGQQPLSGRIVQ